jgi:hypothetical protein
MVVALCCATVGVASAAEPAGSVDLGIDQPTTSISVDGGVVELIPATSYELPPESTTAPAADSQIQVQGVSSEVQGASSSTGPTSSAGVGGSVSVTWFVVGALVVLVAVALWLVRSRRAAQH